MMTINNHHPHNNARALLCGGGEVIPGIGSWQNYRQTLAQVAPRFSPRFSPRRAATRRDPPGPKRPENARNRSLASPPFFRDKTLANFFFLGANFFRQEFAAPTFFSQDFFLRYGRGGEIGTRKTLPIQTQNRKFFLGAFGAENPTRICVEKKKTKSWKEDNR